MKHAAAILAAAALLCSCADALSFRYSPEAVDSLQAQYPLPSFEKVKLDADNPDESGNSSDVFTYGPARPFVAPASPRAAQGGKARLSKDAAKSAISAAFAAEGIYLEPSKLIEFENVSVTLDGFSEAGGIGYIFITAREMRKGPYGSYVGGRAFIDPAEVFALQNSKYRILIVSEDDPRFLFDAGFDTTKPAMSADEIIRGRNAAAQRLYSAARLWLRGR